MAESLLEMFLSNVAQRGERDALVFLGDGETPTEVVTFQGLARRAARVAAELLEHARPGDRVLLLLEPGPEYVATFLGCWWAGIVAVPAYPLRRRTHASRIELIIQDARPRLAVTDDVATVAHLQGSLRTLRARDEAELDVVTAASIAPCLPSAGEAAFLQYTSGSTAEPRGVIVTHANLVHNERAIREAFRPDPDEVSVTWLPPYHDMGLIGSLLQPLAVGMTTVVLSPNAFLQRPLRWVEAISRFRATYSGGPDFAYALTARSASREALAGLDLSSWEVAYQGAERVRPETLEAFTRVFAAAGFRRSAFAPCFGLAEATLMVSGVARGEPARELALDADEMLRGRLVSALAPGARVRRLVACGAPRGGQVRIVDPKTKSVCERGHIGELWFSGPSVASGYYGRDEESETTFRARLAGEEGHWLRTGDLGCLVDGELVVTGRLKDVIIVDGKNHAPEDLEATAAASHASFVKGGTVAFSLERDEGERVVLVQEVQRGAVRSFDGSGALLAVQQAVGEHHGLALYDVVFVRPHALPRTSSGKLRRGACREAYLAGTLSLVERAETAVRSERVLRGAVTIELIRERIAEELKRPAATIDPTLPFTALGVGSLSAVVLSGELSRKLGRPLSPTVFYDYPTIERLAAYLSGARALESAAAPTPKVAPGSTPSISGDAEAAVAVVGMACRFPGANTPLEFLQLLRGGVDAVQPRRPSARPDAHLPGPGGFLDDPSLFDAEHFGIFPREAECMDPQQRLVLELAWEALEDAAIAPDSLGGRAVGVFLGISGFDYSRGRAPQPTSGTGAALSIAANRVSYALDLRGPSLSIDTACSSSLVAVHLACAALRSGECEMALAGGVNLLLDDGPSIVLTQAGMLSPDGRCAAFDRSANGYVRGEGAGFLVLKPLDRARADGDDILAVIRGSAVNQDGRSNGLTAPNGVAQRALIEHAFRCAGVTARDVGLIEAHGTGTPLGDPIEVNSLARVCADRAPGRCFVGSVKSNIGHLEAAAGIAGLMKAILSVRSGEIFPTLHYREVNPEIELGPALAIAQNLELWNEKRRVAGVSSFGFGGTNAHVVVESVPPEPTPSASDSLFLATLSARHQEHLPEAARRLAAWVAQQPDAALARICHSLNVGRAHGAHRRALVVASRAELVEWLDLEAKGASTCALSSSPAGARREFRPLAPSRFGVATDSARKDTEALRATLLRVAEAFVEGACIDWGELGAGTPRLNGLPPTPYRRTRHWVPAMSNAALPRPHRTGRHPLLGQRVLVDGRSGALFQTTVGLDKTPELHDHRAFQHVVVAGACQVSLLIAAHRVLFGDRPATVRNLVFSQGLLLDPGDTRVLQLHVDDPENPNTAFRLISHAEGATTLEGTSIVHAVGSFEPSQETNEHGQDFDTIRARCIRRLSHDEFYALAESHSLQFGASYRWNDEVWAGTGEAVSRLRWAVSSEVASDYELPPGLVDSTFQLAAATGFERDDEAFILFRIREYSCHRRVQHGEPLWAHAIRHSTSTLANVHAFTVRLYDAQGRVVSEARDLELYRASIQGFLRALRPDFLDGLFYGVEWEGWEPTPGELPTRWLAFSADTVVDTAVLDALRTRNADVTVVQPSPGAAGSRSLVPGNGPEAEALLSELLPSSGRFGLVYSWPLSRRGSAESTASLLASQDRGSVGLLALLRVVVRLGRQHDLVLRVIASNAAPEAPESTRDALPLDAPLRGLLKSFSLESPRSDVRFVDVDSSSDPARAALATVAGAPETEVAVRHGDCYVPRLVRKSESVVTDTSRLDPEASYLITGGTGALGLRTAHFLVSRGARHVALMARRAPEGATRDAVASLERLGATIQVLLADVGDEASLAHALAALERPLRGIVHAAGVLADGTLENQTSERFWEALLPKLVGLVHLERLTRHEQLDFLVLFSSAASLLGSPAQANYAAANAFLDAFAAYRERRTVSIWWGPWAEVGMAARQDARSQSALSSAGFELLRPAIAVELLEQFLRTPSRQMAALSLDWKRFFATRPSELPLLARLRKDVYDASPPVSKLRLDLVMRIKTSDPLTGEGLLTTYLRRSVAEAAAVTADAIDPDRRLSDLGLDSLMALGLQTQLEEELGLTVHVTRFMREVSIRVLADELRAELVAGENVAAIPVPTNASTSAPAPESSERQCTEEQRAPRISSVTVARTRERSLDFSLFYFSRRSEGGSDGYRLLVEGSRFADDAGLLAVWLPERHFHEFGGHYPNPSVLASHVAALTKRVRLRAGSVVLPLHHPLRVAEEWAVVDNLSGGRVDLAFVRGWGPNDFVLAPAEFERRSESLSVKLEQVRRLWRGEALEFTNGSGERTLVRSFPRPLQPELPIWLTCTRDDERFIEAGRLGLNVLTALLLQTPSDLERRVALYRQAREASGHDPAAGRVTLMLHTFIGRDQTRVLTQVRAPLEEYLRSSLELWKSGVKSLELLGEREREQVLEYALDRYTKTSSLIGTEQRCLDTALRFHSMGVDEIACLIDFGVADADVLASLPHLASLRDQAASPPAVLAAHA